MRSETELSDLLHSLLVSNRQDGLIADVAGECDVSESLVYRWTQGKDAPRLSHLKGIVRVLKRRDRREEAELLMDHALHDSGYVAVPMPEEKADPASLAERVAEAQEHFSHVLRETSAAIRSPSVGRGVVLQIRAHVCHTQRALQRLAVVG